MPNSAEAFRRWLGMFFLSVAAGMVIWGRTVLQGHLTGWLFPAFWGLCALLAAGAVSLAVADIWLTIRDGRRQHDEVARQTLEKIRHGDEDGASGHD